jgi:Divergent InlB B-repeat domain/The GLUG motif
MRRVLSSRRCRYLARVCVLLLIVTLIAGMAGCDGASEYGLTMAANPAVGGTATDLTDASPYAAGTEVSIEAVTNSGYRFVSWTAPAGTFANADVPQTTFTMPAQDAIVTANFEPAEFHAGSGTAEDPYEITDWYQLDYIRNYLDSYFVLANNLDSTAPGYAQLAGPTAHQGASWQPIGTEDDWFTGCFDGQGHEIRDLFIDRPDEGGIGLFGMIYYPAAVKDLGVIDVNVISYDIGGSLVGINGGNVSYCYSTGSVTSTGRARDLSGVGGLVGVNVGNISHCHSDGSLAGVGPVGGLAGINYFGTVSNSYSTGSISGQDGAGGLMGVNGLGTVTDSYATGSVTGGLGVGGLLGGNSYGTVSNSYSTGDVIGDDYVGGLLGYCGYNGTLSNSHYDYGEVLINGENVITVGALSDEDFDEWLANDMYLDIDGRLTQEAGYYVMNNVDDLEELLAFGQDGSLKFRLNNDLDLAIQPDFYIPYLAGEFDGNGHTISNLTVNSDFLYAVGLFGHLAPGAKVTRVGVENANITGGDNAGGLVGYLREGTVSNSYASGILAGNDRVGGLAGRNSYGDVSNSYSTGSVTGVEDVGGLVGDNDQGTINDSYAASNMVGNNHVGGLAGYNRQGTVSNSYASGSVGGSDYVGGFVGRNYYGTVSNSYSTGSVTGSTNVGGLLGWNYYGNVSSSFWDTETSGQATSDGGTGKTTAQMKSITTFSGAGWSIIAVADSDTRNSSYIWNIVGGTTYPFLSWE